ncbi:SdpI family protein [Pendulispora albinea]|uniref:SdpI family protein n=1 Tax=Pendulispora albinea TaxID=2741071 RepID=A0ABZ2M344_9BACT
MSDPLPIRPGRRIRRTDILAVVALGASFAVTAILWSSLPARIPIHFDVNGVANGFASRAVGGWLLPALAVAMWLLVRFGAAWLPVGARAAGGAGSAGTMASVACALAIFLLAVHTATLRAAESGQLPQSFCPLAIGGLCLTLTILLPRVRRNAFVGVRTPWTLASDENWARTHRLASFTMLAATIACFATALVAPALGVAIACAAVVSAALIPAIYSAFLARGGYKS